MRDEETYLQVFKNHYTWDSDRKLYKAPLHGDAWLVLFRDEVHGTWHIAEYTGDAFVKTHAVVQNEEGSRIEAAKVYMERYDQIAETGYDPTYNPGEPGRTWDDLFKPDSEAPRFYAKIVEDDMLVVEWDQGWHLWRITTDDGEATGHQHVAGPFTWFPNIQDKAVEVFDRIADEMAEAGASDSGGEQVEQKFNVTDDSETVDLLVSYGMPRHLLGDPAAMREALLTTLTANDRLKTTLGLVMPLVEPRWEDTKERARMAAAERTCIELGVDYRKLR